MIKGQETCSESNWILKPFNKGFGMVENTKVRSENLLKKDIKKKEKKNTLSTKKKSKNQEKKEREDAKDQEKKVRKQGLDHAIDQEKASCKIFLL